MIRRRENIQEVPTNTGSRAAPSRSRRGAQSVGGSDFEGELGRLLPSRRNRDLSEEEVFAALVAQRLSALVGESAAEQYRRSLRSIKESSRRDGNGSDGFETSALRALRATVRRGRLSEEQADQVYSQAFFGANLDATKDSLYDRSGDKNDPSFCVKPWDAAINRANRAISRLEQGAQYATLSFAEARNTGIRVPPIGEIGKPRTLGIS